MTQYTLSVGDSSVGYSRVDIGIGQAARTGAHRVFGFSRKGLIQRHSDALASAGNQLANIDPANRKSEMELTGWTRSGDALTVRAKQQA